MTLVTKIWWWAYAAAVAGLILAGAVRAAGPEIAVRVDGDAVILMVRSTVRFTVWSSTNPTAIWWPVYSSPKPVPGQLLVWFGVGSKTGVFPNWQFWRVTAMGATK